MSDGKYLTPEELSKRWLGRISVRTLSNWRCKGEGPGFSKIGGRILYPRDSVERWEESRNASSTAGYVRA